MSIGTIVGVASSLGIGSVIESVTKAYRVSIRKHPIVGTCQFLGVMFFSMMVGDKVEQYAKNTIKGIGTAIEHKEDIKEAVKRAAGDDDEEFIDKDIEGED